jgi:exonuclease III
LILAETWIPEKTDMSNKFQLENYEHHLNSSGRGKGLAIFHKEEYKHISDYNEENINITKIASEDLEVITIYCSNDGSLGKLIRKLKGIINMSNSTVILGDMNICNKKMATNELRKFLEDTNFKQVINKATHIEGGHLNHVYIMNVGNFVETPEIEIIPKYYSDHDSVCIAWEKLNPTVSSDMEK